MFEIIYYFVFLSFCGWIVESLYVSIRSKKIVNRGMLFTPFIPIYGVVGTIVIFIHMHLALNLVLWFLIISFLASIAEFLVSYIAEKVFKVHLWNYKNERFNFKGRVCLKNTILFGLLGCLLVIAIPTIQLLFTIIPVAIWPILFVIIMLDYVANFRAMIIGKKEFIKELGSRNFEFKLHLHHKPVSIKTLLLKRNDLIKNSIREKIEQELQKIKHN